MAKFQKRELSTDQPLGEQLRAVRRTANLSLDQVAMATKIRRTYIEALERGNYDAFPAEVYLRGFLENYAGFLGFPVDEVLHQYKRERGITPTDIGEKRELDVPARFQDASRLTITPRTIGYGLAILSLFLAVGYLITQLFGFAAPPKLEVIKPAANATIAAESVDVEGKTDPGAEVSINNQPVPTDTEGGFKEKVRLLPGANSLRVAAKNKSNRERVLSRSIVSQLPGPPTPTPAASAAPNGLLFTVKIGPNSAYVTINVDGKDAFQGLLLPNTEQSFLALSRVLLTTSNAGSTRVMLGSQDQGTVGREGEYRRGIEYPVTPSPQPTPSAKP